MVTITNFSHASSSSFSGISSICEMWIHLRHAQPHLKAAILGSIATVLEYASSSNQRWRLIQCIGHENGLDHGIPLYVNFCRISPSVEVRLGAYRCLHVLSRDDAVIQYLFHDNVNLQFLQFISGREGNENTKECKEAKHGLLARILGNKLCKSLISDKWFKELETIVQMGPFSIPASTVSDPLVE